MSDTAQITWSDFHYNYEPAVGEYAVCGHYYIWFPTSSRHNYKTTYGDDVLGLSPYSEDAVYFANRHFQQESSKNEQDV
jgi:hypothetical protein